MKTIGYNRGMRSHFNRFQKLLVNLGVDGVVGDLFIYILEITCCDYTLNLLLLFLSLLLL